MTETTDQYRIIANGAGWLDRQSSGRLRIDGRDALGFLHALVTGDVQSLVPGRAVYAAYLTPQGRMIADLTIHRLEDGLLIQTAPGQGGPLAHRLDQLIFAEDARVIDISPATGEIEVLGPHAAAALAHAFGSEADVVTSLAPLSHVVVQGTTIARAEDLGACPVFGLIFAREAFGELVRRLESAGVAPVSADVVEAMRIEAGRPRFGVDMTDETIPLEAGLLDRAISTTKGCYVGQEVIIRVLHRGGGRVAKRLVTLAFDAALDRPPAAGTPLFDHDREVGRITSAAVSPAHGHVVALGYVRREDAEPGRALTAKTPEGGWSAQVTGLGG